VIKTSITVFLIFIFLIPLQVFSQSDQETIPLITILNLLQKKFDCNFTYIDEDIEEIQIQNPPLAYNLKEVIQYLDKNTPIEYTFVNDKNIVLGVKTKKIKICGFLQSLADNKVLVNATIKTKNNTVLSDEKGEFSLMIDTKKQWINIYFMGYKSIRILASDLMNKPCKTIVLTPQIQFLGEVVLNDYLVKGINKKSNGSIVINYNDFGIITSRGFERFRNCC